jgi:hypothetical protein
VPQPSTSTATNATSANSQITLLANKHVWVEVKSAVSGDNLFIGYMEQGDQKSFDGGEQGLRIRVPDGGSINVSYQGKSEPLGASGAETERVITPTSAIANKEPTATTTPVVSTTPATSITTNQAATTPNTTAGGIEASHKPTTVKQPNEVSTNHRRLDESRRSYSSNESSTTNAYKYNGGRLDSE